MEYDDLRKDIVDNIIMEAYGITRNQYFLFNSDYQKLLRDNYFKILQKEYSLKEKVKEKRKVLGIFRKK